ncbi:hypothetical protein KBD71_02040 [Candidatus Woesebacteria bacterium]|nr:hypothetical protein [Candidatus Woesebacteria bacterium]
MNSYVRGGFLGFATILVAGHAHPAILMGFLVITLINLGLITSYFFRYLFNK